MTVAGTVASEVLRLCSETTRPPLGAPLFRNIVPVPGWPPGTVPSNCTDNRSGNKVTSAAVVAPLNVPEMRTFVAVVTLLVPIVNEAEVWPAGTVTLAGMVAGTVPGPPLENDFDSATTAPPDGALPLNVTVPDAGLPPVTESGVMARALIVSGPPGVINNNALCPGLPARLANTFRLNCDVTVWVLIVKSAVV